MSRLNTLRHRAARPHAADHRAAPPRIARRGFTLVEVLVTLSLLGVVGTIVTRMLMDQQRFFQQTNEQMGVRRELRSAVSLLPADLRSMSSVGGDIQSFDATQITFRTTTGAAIICAKQGTTIIDLPPLNMARTTLASWYTTPVVGDTIFAFRADSMGAGGDSWAAHRITAVASDATLCPLSPFLDPVLDVGKLRWRLTVTPALADSEKVGASIRFTRSVKYSLVAGTGTNFYLGKAEYLSGVWGAATAVAGPFVAPAANGSGGLAFALYDSVGVVINNVANAAAVSRIDVRMRGQGVSASGAYGTMQTPKDSLLLRIALRNRQ